MRSSCVRCGHRGCQVCLARSPDKEHSCPCTLIMQVNFLLFWSALEYLATVTIAELVANIKTQTQTSSNLKIPGFLGFFNGSGWNLSITQSSSCPLAVLQVAAVYSTNITFYSPPLLYCEICDCPIEQWMTNLSGSVVWIGQTPRCTSLKNDGTTKPSLFCYPY